MSYFTKSFSETFTNAIQTKSILVVGDVMLDEYHWCDVKRISPEAPVPVCKVNKTTLSLGGAANVAANIVALGANVQLCGVIGNDSSGEKLIHLLNELRVQSTGLLKTDYPTILKSRIIAKNQHVVRVDRDDHETINDDIRNNILAFIQQHISTYDAIVISDYLKGLLSDQLTQSIILLARSHQCKVIIDPKGNNYSKYTNANIITPNYLEFCQATKSDYNSEEDIFAAAVSLKKTLNLDSLIVTRSEKGMTIVNTKTCCTIPTTALDVFDITGAGDTVIAVLTLCLVYELETKESAIIANIAAGIVVQKVGTAHVSAHELITAMVNYEPKK